MTTTQATKSTAAINYLNVGDYIVAGWDGDPDSDMGEILSISDCGEYAIVAWQIGACRMNVRLDSADITFWQDRDAAQEELDTLRASI